MGDARVIERFRAAARTCERFVVHDRPVEPAARLRAIAEFCEAAGIDEWDVYGSGGAVALLEHDVADVLGTEAAAFFPSGIMAQQAALRIWCDRSGSRRVALPDLSHLLLHELDGPRLLHAFEIEHLTSGAATPTVDHLAAIPGRLGAVLIELPLREPGCLLPTYDELTAFSGACRDRGVPLHVDGARIWEAAAAYDRSPADVAAVADSVYVSFYKALGGLAGSALAGPADVIDEARRWRRRHGGTLFRMTPEAVAALMGLRDVLPTIPASVAWARDFAAALPSAISVSPSPPTTNTFLVFGAGDPASINERILHVATRERLLLSSMWSATEEPGRARTEVTIGRGALTLDPTEMATRFASTVLA